MKFVMSQNGEDVCKLEDISAMYVSRADYTNSTVYYICCDNNEAGWDGCRIGCFNKKETALIALKTFLKAVRFTHDYGYVTIMQDEEDENA